MSLSQLGSAAGRAVDAPRPPEPAHPEPSNADLLLDAIRRSLAPADPVARLLAGWLAPPARSACTTRVRPTPG